MYFQKVEPIDPTHAPGQDSRHVRPRHAQRPGREAAALQQLSRELWIGMVPRWNC